MCSAELRRTPHSALHQGSVSKSRRPDHASAGSDRRTNFVVAVVYKDSLHRRLVVGCTTTDSLHRAAKRAKRRVLL